MFAPSATTVVRAVTLFKIVVASRFSISSNHLEAPFHVASEIARGTTHQTADDGTDDGHWRAHASNNASPTPKTRKGSRVSATPAIDVLLLPTAEARSTAAEISIAGIGATDRWSAWLRLLF